MRTCCRRRSLPPTFPHAHSVFIWLNVVACGEQIYSIIRREFEQGSMLFTQTNAVLAQVAEHLKTTAEANAAQKAQLIKLVHGVFKRVASDTFWTVRPTLPLFGSFWC
jgi:hypothetical protein